MIKRAVGTTIVLALIIGLAIVFFHSETYQLLFPKNNIENGATSTGHTIVLADGVTLSRTSAKKDSLIIEQEHEQVFVQGFFDRLDFDKEYALLFEEERQLYYFIHLKTMELEIFTEDDRPKSIEKNTKNLKLKKHYYFDWT